jgi:hypothetical protein
VWQKRDRIEGAAKLTCVRMTIHDAKTLSTMVALGTATMRMAVLINGMASTKSKIVV